MSNDEITIDNNDEIIIVDDHGIINLGLCCIVNSLRNFKDKQGKKQEIFSGRTINNRIYYTIEKAKVKALKNIADIPKLIDFCFENNIKCFRLGSDIFPRYDDPNVENYSMDFAKEELKKVGDYIKLKNIRVLMHPCQLVNLGSPSEEVYKSSVKILEYHANILDYMNIDENGVLIIHGGGRYNDKEGTKKILIDRINSLPDNIKKRLTIENCERGYNVRDCLDISSETDIPVVFDWHHYECYNLINNEFVEKPSDFLDEVISSWGNRIPVMHISNQKIGAKIGAHSDYITKFPEELFEYIKDKNITIHLEVEAKAKEDAIFELRKLFPELQ